MKNAVNLGCGLQTAPGWINLDNSPNILLSKFPTIKWILWKTKLIGDIHYHTQFPKDVISCELTKPLPFTNDSMDFVYTSHFLEHLSKDQAKKVLIEIHRILKPGGIARIVLPDLFFFINIYLEEKIRHPEIAADNLLTGLNIITKARDPHLWMYDVPSIVDKLRKIGFEKITVCEFKKGRCLDVELLDNRPGESLFIEVEKH